MKSTAMLVAAMAAMLVVNTSGARSQEACAKDYLTCMNFCVERPTKGLQEPCLNSCQTRNNQCSEQIYGSRRETNPTSHSTVTTKKAPGAKEAVSPPPRAIEVAPRKIDPAARKAEGSLRQVDVPARLKAEASSADTAVEAKK